MQTLPEGSPFFAPRGDHCLMCNSRSPCSPALQLLLLLTLLWASVSFNIMFLRFTYFMMQKPQITTFVGERQGSPNSWSDRPLHRQKMIFRPQIYLIIKMRNLKN